MQRVQALMPHLSMYLRVSPAARRPRLPFGGRLLAPLSRCSYCTVLLPESFRGGCSVGVVAKTISSVQLCWNIRRVPKETARGKFIVRLKSIRRRVTI